MKLWLALISTFACFVAGRVAAQDAFEDDDTPETSGFIGINGDTELHDFHDAGDADWVRFLAEEGHPVKIYTENLEASPEGDTYLELFEESDLVNPIDTNDDVGGGDLSSVIFLTFPDTAIYYVRVTYSPLGTGTGFGPDTHYDLNVITEEAECLDETETIVSGHVAGAVGNVTSGQVVCIRWEGAGIPTKTLNINGSGNYLTASLLGDPDAPGFPYRLKVTAPGFPVHVVAHNVISCFDNIKNLTLNKNNLANAAVNFTLGQNDLQDGITNPYRTLGQGKLAVAPGSNINLVPATSTETFTGINGLGGDGKAMNLININPGGGVVRIGDTGARSVEFVESGIAPQTGFISRGAK